MGYDKCRKYRYLPVFSAILGVVSTSITTVLFMHDYSGVVVGPLVCVSFCFWISSVSSFILIEKNRKKSDENISLILKS